MNAVTKTPAPAPAVLSATGVARLLNLNESYFRNRRATLERDHGFPPKLPGINGWSKAAVMRWISTNGETYLPGQPRAEHSSEEVSITVAARALEDEYANAGRQG
ncbi:MAG: hypothetical protein RLO21_00795 [Nitratireductor sp.]